MVKHTTNSTSSTPPVSPRGSQQQAKAKGNPPPTKNVTHTAVTAPYKDLEASVGGFAKYEAYELLLMSHY